MAGTIHHSTYSSPADIPPYHLHTSYYTSYRAIQSFSQLLNNASSPPTCSPCELQTSSVVSSRPTPPTPTLGHFHKHDRNQDLRMCSIIRLINPHRVHSPPSLYCTPLIDNNQLHPSPLSVILDFHDSNLAFQRRCPGNACRAILPIMIPPCRHGIPSQDHQLTDRIPRFHRPPRP